MSTLDKVKKKKKQISRKSLSGPVTVKRKFDLTRREILSLAERFVNHAKKNKDYLVVNEFFVNNGVICKTVIQWRSEFEEFERAYNLVHDIVECRLIKKGLKDGGNTRFLELNLKLNYGWKEKDLKISSKFGENNAHQNIEPAPAGTLGYANRPQPTQSAGAVPR